jgi:hypothetical protein
LHGWAVEDTLSIAVWKLNDRLVLLDFLDNLFELRDSPHLPYMSNSILVCHLRRQQSLSNLLIGNLGYVSVTLLLSLDSSVKLSHLSEKLLPFDGLLHLL